MAIFKLTLRDTKGSALTHAELDENFTSLSSSLFQLNDTYPTGSFTGSFTGSLSGSLTGSHSGSGTGSYSGSFTGSYTGSFSGSFSGSLGSNIIYPSLAAHDYANDEAATNGGIPLYGFYHTSGTLKIRIS